MLFISSGTIFIKFLGCSDCLHKK
ncbi:unnamed protein product [Spirodela intermedia]|uniref:Uncharacterized protein n=2 Tax=Spirodela intermedia TaxID=51605 RepID=A0A7I8LMV6_SPIIN|nr:unnamed protein product [Spirodela intermedia]CAA6673726.1 unnamed protein product [Spirodela intermedia]CAA7410966.1 unnamed protein product [Spirodela intermedia]